MRVLDLFSGIGGFSLGLERAGMTTVAFCEIDPFCRRVLAKHWPNVPLHEDVRKLKGSDVGSIDVICGGYPCQPFSLAGKRAGAADDRHLWPEMRRLVDELRPSWVIGENVAGHLNMGLDDVLSDLGARGYACRPFVIPACAVGAWHRRDRVWIVAHAGGEQHEGCSASVGRTISAELPRDTNSEGQPAFAVDGQVGGLPPMGDANSAGLPFSRPKPSRAHGLESRRVLTPGGGRATQPPLGRVAAGLPPELDGVVGAEEHDQAPRPDGRADADRLPGLRRDGGANKAPSELRGAGSLRGSVSAVPRQGGPEGRASSHQAAEELQGLRQGVHADAQQEAHHMQPRVPFGHWPHERGEAVGIWSQEPDVPRVAKGVTNRVARLKGLGNAVVPQIPEAIGRAILAAEGAFNDRSQQE